MSAHPADDHDEASDDDVDRGLPRAVLALPGVGPLTAVALVARIPSTAAAVVLNLHVVLTMGQGYAAAGLVAAALTTGSAIGAPLLGA